MTTPAPLPPNVYRLPQKDFDAIPGSPWVYSVSTSIRKVYQTFLKLENIAQPRQGLATADNFRFLRFWWEIGSPKKELNLSDQIPVNIFRDKWFPAMKGGKHQRWYGNQEYVVNWKNNGYELKSWADPLYGHSGWSRIIKSVDYYFREGITWSLLSSKNPSFRWMKPGWIISHKGPGIYLNSVKDTLNAIAILNSECSSSLLQTICPNLGFETGQVALLPWPENRMSKDILAGTATLIHSAYYSSTNDEATFDFIVPYYWGSNLDGLTSTRPDLIAIEAKIDDEVYRLYEISASDRAAIEAELAGGALTESEEIDEGPKTEDEEETAQGMSREELAARWVSYAIGIVLGRFVVGDDGRQTMDEGQRSTVHRPLGCAVYHRDDFAIGSLPAPDEDEFNELVGNPPTPDPSPTGRGESPFAYIDAQGGRHVFPAETERALNALAFEDGISVLEAGHPRDLAARVEKALVLMLGENGFEDVMAALYGENGQPSAVLRQFLEKDYFTQWHFKWYRKRPIYWPIQSAKRAYGFVLFHEKITRDTLYAIQREPYLDTKRNAVALKIGDLQAGLAGLQGASKKRLEKELDELRKLEAELKDFASELEFITLGGYNHAPEWIDDGVILRLAPLHKVIPLWKSEPKKYWERLEAGDFDWSHIAINYWPARVREKCKTNKSYAIAHGHEAWYEAK